MLADVGSALGLVPRDHWQNVDAFYVEVKLRAKSTSVGASGG